MGDFVDNKSQSRSNGCLTVTALLIGLSVLGCAGLAFLGALMGPESAHREGASGAAPVARASAATPLAPEQTCEVVAGTFSNDKLTDLQKGELWKDYRGKVFTWDLRITDVKPGILGGFQIQAKCQRSRAFVADVLIEVPDARRSAVLQLQVDTIYTLSGELNNWSNFIGLTADWRDPPSQ